MIRTIIVESDRFTMKDLTKILSTNYNNIDIVAKAANVLDAIKYIQNLNPDLVFINRQIQELNCSFILDCLPNLNLKFILMSSKVADAIYAIKLEAIYFLAIPFDFNEIRQAIHKYSTSKDTVDSRHYFDKKILVKTEKLEKLISVTEIIAIEAMRGYCKIIIHDKTEIIVSKSMSHFIKHHSIADKLITVHKSYSVNYDYIDSIDKQSNSIILKNGSSYKISVRKMKLVFDLLKRNTVDRKNSTLGKNNHTNNKFEQIFYNIKQINKLCLNSFATDKLIFYL